MRGHFRTLFGPGSGRHWATALAVLLASGLLGCEAKLRLQDVAKARTEAIRRTDQFQAGIIAGKLLVVVASHGVIVKSTDRGLTWVRQELAGWPSLIDITQCPNGDVIALAFEGQIWTAPASADKWTLHKIDSKETPQALTCDPHGRLWVVGSYSSIVNSADGGKTWTTQSLDQDLFLTSIQFLDDKNAIATGEFGTVAKTHDGGTSWQSQNAIPEEFYPADTWFQNLSVGWAVGLRGRVMQTVDGGTTWTLQSTPTLAPLFRLNSVDGVPYAVGGDGVIMRFEGGAWQLVPYDSPFHLYLRVLLPIGDELLIAGGSGALRVLPRAAPVKALADVAR
ncbi:MAG: hypothetical protein HYX63_08365 [Gammaproteobacteria bacterium]|nr:hypothetical protein [Gammaproteobacteria bacterium]